MSAHERTEEVRFYGLNVESDISSITTLERYARGINALLLELGESADCTPKQLAVLLDSEQGLLLITSVGVEIIAMATVSIFHRAHKSEAWIEDVAVAALYRRRGIGRKLIQQCVDFARMQKAKHIELISGDKWPEGHALYRSLGFQQYGTNYFSLDV